MKKWESQPQPEFTEDNIADEIVKITNSRGDSVEVLKKVYIFLSKVKPNNKEDHRVDVTFKINEMEKNLAGGKSMVEMQIIYAKGKFQFYPLKGATNRIFDLMDKAKIAVEEENKE